MSALESRRFFLIFVDIGREQDDHKIFIRPEVGNV